MEASYEHLPLIGHREAGENLRVPLAAVERHIIDYGVDSFTVGRYDRFYYLAGQVVAATKDQHPEITLHLLISYHPYDRPIKLSHGIDSSFYLPWMESVPKRLAIVRANRYMVDNSDYLITYARHPGNPKELLKYAQVRERKGLIHIENLTEKV